MAWNIQPLLPVLSKYYYRRPVNVKNTNNAATPVKAGGNAQFSISGGWLQDVTKLYCSSDRITFQDVQCHGTGENTTITAVINANDGDDVNNIKVWGFVGDLENNITAEFSVDNAIKSEDVEPKINDFTATMVDPKKPEIFKIDVNANNVKTITVDADGKTEQTNLLSFYFVFKQDLLTINELGEAYTKPIIKPMTLQGQNDGKYSNKITKNIQVPRRPFLNDVNLTAYNAARVLTPQIVNRKFPDGTTKPVLFFLVDLAALGWGDSPKGIPVAARLVIDLGWDLGDLNYPIVDYTYQTDQVKSPFVINSTKKSATQLELNVTGNNTNGATENITYIYFTPINNVGTLGLKGLIGLSLYQVAQPSYSSPAGMPSGHGLGVNFSYTDPSLYGIGYNKEVSAIITNFKP